VIGAILSYINGLILGGRGRPPNQRSQLFDFDPKLVGNQRRSAAFRPNLFIDVHPKPCF
jgi:hypothetical protein